MDNDLFLLVEEQKRLKLAQIEQRKRLLEEQAAYDQAEYEDEEKEGEEEEPQSNNPNTEEEEKKYVSNTFSFSNERTHPVPKNFDRNNMYENMHHEEEDEDEPLNSQRSVPTSEENFSNTSPRQRMAPQPNMIDIGKLSAFQKMKMKDQMMLSSLQIINYHK